MRHREICSWIKNRFPQNLILPLRLLDLCCGNAFVSVEAFDHLSYVDITGVDLSKVHWSLLNKICANQLEY